MTHAAKPSKPAAAVPPAPRLAGLRAFSVDQLAVSPLNVRTNQEDAEATDALEASIVAHGLLFPLVVHPIACVSGAGPAWGVLAGGRRLRALRKLVAAGQLAPDFAVPCVVRDVDGAECVELSLAENLLRRDLRPYEVHAAFVSARDQGASAEEIAARFGQRVAFVRQQLRLGSLAPEIFAAYAEGRVHAAEAQSYAATEDAELQRAAFRHFGESTRWDRSADIRRWLKVGDYHEALLLKFVGDEIYRAAGGRFELDLFADEESQRGRVGDPALLRTQADNKLAEVRQRLRQRTGRSDLTFLEAPPRIGDQADYSLRIEPETRGQKIVLPPETEGAEVAAVLTLMPSGAAEPGFWWASRKAKRDAEHAANPGAAPVQPLDAGFADYSTAPAARAAAKDEHGLTADGLQAVRSLRRELLRALLLEDAACGYGNDTGTLGRDYILWAQLRQELNPTERAVDTGARGLAGSFASGDSVPVEFVQPLLEETEAHRAWRTALDLVAASPAMVLADPAEGFTAFHAEPEHVKNRAGAVLAGLALLRSANTGGYRIAVHDRLAVLAGGADPKALRRAWTPTPAFLGLFPKAKRLELAQTLVGQATTTHWGKLKDKELSQVVAGVLAGDGGGWVHPLLTFGPPPWPLADAGEDAAELQEAAE